MKNKEHSHFLPSPFQTVTSYENKFVGDGRKFLANSMVEVLQYIAQATSFAIKDKKVQIDNNLSLAVE